MMKKYGSYKDSGVEWIGEIPSHWVSTPLKRVVFIGNGKDYKHIEIEEGGYPVYGTGGEFSRCSDYLHIGPSVLLGRKGTINNPLYIEEPFWTSDTIYYTVINEDKIIPKLLYHLVHQIPFSLFSYGSAIPSMSKSHYEEMRFPIPPLSEQEEIVQFLDEKTSLIDSLIEKTKRKIELLKEERTSLINEVVTKGLNPNVEMKDSGVEWIGEIPRGWKLYLGSYLGEYFKGKGIKKDEVLEFGFPCLRYGEIYTHYNLKFIETRSFINSETSENSVSYGYGTLFLTGSGEKSEEIGKCVVYLGESLIWVGGDIIVLKPYERLFNPLFLSYLINSECIRIQREISSKGDIIVHIYSKNFREMKFPIPPLSEQEEIVQFLDEKTSTIDKTIELEVKRIDYLKEYRQSLISEVVTGKIKVITDE